MSSLVVSVVVVSYRCPDLLRRCLETVREGVAPHVAEVVVVDNHSQDGTVPMVRKLFRWVTLVASERNLGFAAGNNLGLTHTTAPYVVFLNPDTECMPGSLARLVEELRIHADLGMTAPRLLNSDGTLQRSIRALPTVPVSVLVLAKLYRLMRMLPAVRRYDRAAFDYEESQDVEQPMGACMVTRRSVLEQVGAFDERFWMWFEEVDLCKRILAAGWQIRYVADARVVHAMGASSVQLHNVLRQRRYAASLITYFAKHQPGWRVAVLRVAAAVGLAASYVGQAVWSLTRRDPTRHRLDAQDLQ